MSRRHALGIAALCLAPVVVAALAPADGFGWPTCLFHAVTHLPCPSCGLTRSWIASLDGDIGAAFAFNVAGPLLLVAIVLIGVFSARDAALGTERLPAFWRRRRRPITVAVIVVLCAAWVVNLMR